MSEQKLDEILTVDEVASYLKITKITTYKLAKKGELPFIKIGNSFRMRKSELIELTMREDSEVRKA
ncbi:MAG: helix-turn-helix domain-containing protein [Deltaproteobacteria bacterium]|nr:helix-turn-helix domain-containing protein [Deltaproteobacteria bacterium]